MPLRLTIANESREESRRVYEMRLEIRRRRAERLGLAVPEELPDWSANGPGCEPARHQVFDSPSKHEAGSDGAGRGPGLSSNPRVIDRESTV